MQLSNGKINTIVLDTHAFLKNLEEREEDPEVIVNLVNFDLFALLGADDSRLIVVGNVKRFLRFVYMYSTH